MLLLLVFVVVLVVVACWFWFSLSLSLLICWRLSVLVVVAVEWFSVSGLAPAPASLFFMGHSARALNLGKLRLGQAAS